MHCDEANSAGCDVVLQVQFPSGEVVPAPIRVRPYARDTLERLSQHFELIAFTASHACYAHKVLDFLDPKGQLFSHRLTREHCLAT